MAFYVNKPKESEQNETNQKMETISLDYLYPGLVVRDDIYNYNGKLLLVAAGITLTDIIISRLKKFNNLERNIKVSTKVYHELKNKGLPHEIRQDNFEKNVGYSEIKNETTRLLTIAQITNSVPYEQVCDVGNLVLERIHITEPAVLFQCINGSNEVDEYLYRHSTNVAILNGLIGKWLELKKEEIETLVLLGLVHDMGKTRIPPEILNSPNKLTEAEFNIVKNHAVYSYEMLSDNNKFGETIKKAARHHHEKMNGKGYPDGLTADNIPFYSRITSISDIYDAMVSKRCYKNAQSPFKVLLEMQTEQFSGLDIRLVKLFNDQMPKELVGKAVLLSDGSAGVVRYVNDLNIEYPLVEVSGETIMTNENLYCVSMLINED